MTVLLRNVASTFATRERARTIAEGIPAAAREATVDFGDVRASPSFIAELLTILAGRGVAVAAVGADAFHARMIVRLAEQLRVSDRVRVVETV